MCGTQQIKKWTDGAAADRVGSTEQNSRLCREHGMKKKAGQKVQQEGDQNGSQVWWWLGFT